MAVDATIFRLHRPIANSLENHVQTSSPARCSPTLRRSEPACAGRRRIRPLACRFRSSTTKREAAYRKSPRDRRRAIMRSSTYERRQVSPPTHRPPVAASAQRPCRGRGSSPDLGQLKFASCLRGHSDLRPSLCGPSLGPACSCCDHGGRLARAAGCACFAVPPLFTASSPAFVKRSRASVIIGNTRAASAECAASTRLDSTHLCQIEPRLIGIQRLAQFRHALSLVSTTGRRRCADDAGHVTVPSSCPAAPATDLPRRFRSLCGHQRGEPSALRLFGAFSSAGDGHRHWYFDLSCFQAMMPRLPSQLRVVGVSSRRSPSSWLRQMTML